MGVKLRQLWQSCRAVLVHLGLLDPRPQPCDCVMRDDLQIVWRNPDPPPRQKAQLSKGEAGDRLAIYPSGRQVWFEDVSGGHALRNSHAVPQILPVDDYDGA